MIERWLAFAAAEGARPGTLRLREHYLTDLARTVDPLAATTEDLVAWFNAHEWAPETRKSARSAVRSFYRWAVDEGLVDVDPSRRLRPVHVPASKPKPTPELVVEDAMANATEVERCMIALAAWAGLRRNEIAELRWSDIGVDAIRVRGKGGVVRVVPLHPRVEHALRERKNATTGGGGRSRHPKAPVSTGCSPPPFDRAGTFPRTTCTGTSPGSPMGGRLTPCGIGSARRRIGAQGTFGRCRSSWDTRRSRRLKGMSPHLRTNSGPRSVRLREPRAAGSPWQEGKDSHDHH